MRALAEKIAAEVAEQFNFGGETERGDRYDYIPGQIETLITNYFKAYQPAAASVELFATHCRNGFERPFDSDWEDDLPTERMTPPNVARETTLAILDYLNSQGLFNMQADCLHEQINRQQIVSDITNMVSFQLNSHQRSFGEGPVDCQTAQAINDLHGMGFRWSVGYDPGNTEYVVAGVHTTPSSGGTIIIRDDTLFAAVKRAQTEFTAFEDLRNVQDNDN